MAGLLANKVRAREACSAARGVSMPVKVCKNVLPILVPATSWFRRREFIIGDSNGVPFAPIRRIVVEAGVKASSFHVAYIQKE